MEMTSDYIKGEKNTLQYTNGKHEARENNDQANNNFSENIAQVRRSKKKKRRNKEIAIISNSENSQINQDYDAAGSASEEPIKERQSKIENQTTSFYNNLYDSSNDNANVPKLNSFNGQNTNTSSNVYNTTSKFGLESGRFTRKLSKSDFLDTQRNISGVTNPTYIESQNDDHVPSRKSKSSLQPESSILSKPLPAIYEYERDGNVPRIPFSNNQLASLISPPNINSQASRIKNQINGHLSIIDESETSFSRDRSRVNIDENNKLVSFANKPQPHTSENTEPTRRAFFHPSEPQETQMESIDKSVSLPPLSTSRSGINFSKRSSIDTESIAREPLPPGNPYEFERGFIRESSNTEKPVVKKKPNKKKKKKKKVTMRQICCTVL